MKSLYGIIVISILLCSQLSFSDDVTFDDKNVVEWILRSIDRGNEVNISESILSENIP